MDYIPHTQEEEKEMLAEIGISSFEELLKDVPPALRKKKMNLPAGMSEPEILKLMKGLAKKRVHGQGELNFVGAGAYEHFIPTVINHLANRSEFSTAYTPYQPEASQGTLQAIFEYQTLMAELTALDISNASLYDGASAVAEAAMAALNYHQNRTEFLVASTLHPEYLQTLKTYLAGLPLQFKIIPKMDGGIDLDFIKNNLTDKVAAVMVQNPNFLGCLEPMKEVGELVQKSGALFVSVVNPLSLGVLKPPGEVGAHIAVGEAQPLGNPLAYGGPYLGFFAASKELMRKVPGRIAGVTKDQQGRCAYVLTLQAREQHIRREKAVSNICTNQSLIALRAAIYLTSLGKEGIKEVGKQNVLKSHYAKEILGALPGYKIKFENPFFNEFVLEVPNGIPLIEKRLLDKGIWAGLPLGKYFPELSNALLVCVTETKTKEDIETLRDALKEI